MNVLDNKQASKCMLMDEVKKSIKIKNININIASNFLCLVDNVDCQLDLLRYSNIKLENMRILKYISNIQLLCDF